jgi:toxin ParE1/3/4
VRLRYSPKAAQDILEIADYASDFSTSGAIQLIDRLEQAIDRLLTFPSLGRIREDLHSALRSWSVDDWVIFYRVLEGDILEVARIVRGSRDIEEEVRGL